MRISVIPGSELSPEHVRRWAEIQEANPELASPYFRPEFTVAVASERDDVYVGVLEERGLSIGFFPFQRDWKRVGVPVGGPLSNCHGLVVSNDAEWRVEDLMRACSLAAWEFKNLLASQEPFRPYHRAIAPLLYMDIARGYDTYAQELREAGSGLAKQLDRKLRKIEREIGEIRFEAQTSDIGELHKLMRWKSEQYLRSGLVDVFSFDWTVRLLERIHSTRTCEFSGMLSVLYVNDEAAAIHFGMRSRTVLDGWFIRHDERLAKYSPGLVLLLLAGRCAESLGIRRIDLGKCDDGGSYKLRLATGSVPLAEGSAELPGVVTVARRLRRNLETWVRQSSLVGLARIPGRWICRAERRSRFR